MPNLFQPDPSGPRYTLPGYTAPVGPREHAFTYLVSKQKPAPYVPHGMRADHAVGKDRKVLGLHVVTHSLLIPQFWPGQVVVVAKPFFHERFRLVRYRGLEFACRVMRHRGDSRVRPGTLVIHFDVDLSVCPNSVEVAEDDPAFEELGAVLYPSGGDAQIRARLFWPCFHNTVN